MKASHSAQRTRPIAHRLRTTSFPALRTSDSAFGDFGKDDVAMSLTEEGVDARIRLLERRDRIARLLFAGRIRTSSGATNHADSQARNDKTSNELRLYGIYSEVSERELPMAAP
jgi:hypothetical protein